MAVHNDVRFVCPFEGCSVKFTAKSSLYIHMKRHKGQNEAGLRCVIESCGHKFNDSLGLGNHVSSTHAAETAKATYQEPNDEANVAAAELDFIALLSSVGDDIEDLSKAEQPKLDDHHIVSEPNGRVKDLANLGPVGQELITVDASAISPAGNELEFTVIRKKPAIAVTKRKKSLLIRADLDHEKRPSLLKPKAVTETIEIFRPQEQKKARTRPSILRRSISKNEPSKKPKLLHTESTINLQDLA